ncbi:hypothetical protein A2U01_0041288, partial [Trifolium medium]|nr:hypothetical protein [Trifolium medium]
QALELEEVAKGESAGSEEEEEENDDVDQDDNTDSTPCVHLVCNNYAALILCTMDFCSATIVLNA